MVSFLGVSALTFATSSICFFVGTPLVSSKSETTDIFQNFAETIQLSNPHTLLVFIGAFWSLIGLSHFLGIGEFMVGFIILFASFGLVIGVVIVWINQRQPIIFMGSTTKKYLLYRALSNLAVVL